MSTFVRALVLAAGMAALVCSAPLSVAPAQDKKGDKDKKDAKEAPKAKAGAGSVEVYEAKDGFRFRIKDADGKVLAMPAKGFEKKEDAVKAIEQIKTILGGTTAKDIKEVK